MNNTISLSLDNLRCKLTELDIQIKKLEQEKSHLEYIVSNFFHNSTDTNVLPQTLSAEQISYYDSGKNTKDLLVDILKKEGGRGRVEKWYEIFHQVKPEIRQSTVHVSLAQMSRNLKYPVRLKNAEYWYEEKVNV